MKWKTRVTFLDRLWTSILQRKHLSVSDFVSFTGGLSGRKRGRKSPCYHVLSVSVSGGRKFLLLPAPQRQDRVLRRENSVISLVWKTIFLSEDFSYHFFEEISPSICLLRFRSTRRVEIQTWHESTRIKIDARRLRKEKWQ